MRKSIRAFGFGALIAAMAAPVMADGVMFQPVAPEGLDATNQTVAETMQAGLPAQMARFEAAGYGHFGALAVPVGVEIKPESLAAVANLETTDAAKIAVLDACKVQTGAGSCTVIGFIVPK